jgi:ABC-type nickel/cobalt efflux system permease component RcnA
MRPAIRGITTALLVAGASMLGATPALAHPTDEVVQQVYLTPAASGPFTATIDTDGDGALSPVEVDAHTAAVQSTVAVQVDGRPVGLALTGHTYPPVGLLAAAGGTVSLVWRGDLPADAHQVVVTDRYATAGRPAVQMSVLVPPDPVPLGRIAHADEGRSMTVALNPATAPAPAPAADAPAAAGASMLDALRRPLTSPWALLALIGACCLLGGLHALTPGHGKTLLTAYLVGDRGTPRQAVALGTVITFSHTAAVLALGGAVLAAGDRVLPAAVVPVLTLVAGVVVLALGIRLVRRRWRPAPPEAHGHDGHGHSALLTRPTGLRTIATMGLTAGMIPCPEALSVLLLAIGLHRTGLGLVMIVAFSVGLAAVLVGLGLLLVTAAPAVSRLTDRRSAWLPARLPLVSAVVVAVLGGVMTVSGVTGLVA